MKINGLEVSDDGIKTVIADLYLEKLLLNQMIEAMRVELAKGYNMKIVKLPDGLIRLEPEGNEAEVLQWVEQTMGSTALKDHIQKFIDQRIAQRDYDELMSLSNDFKTLDSNDRELIKESIRSKALFKAQRVK